MILLKNMWKDVSFLLLSLLMIVLGLGTWNPFQIVHATENTEQGSNMLSIISVLFLGYLFLKRGSNCKFEYPYRNCVVIFIIVLFFSTLINDINDFGFSNVIFFFKLIVGVAYCYVFPKVYVNKLNYIYYGFIIFTLTCVIIAVLSLGGFLGGHALINHGGRMWLFGENPNSTGGRMALSIFFILFIVVENPLLFNKWRYLFLLFIIPLFILLLGGGSRGSLIILAVVSLFFLLFRKTQYLTNKIFMIAVFCCSSIYAFNTILSENSEYSIAERMASTIDSGNDAGRKELNQKSLNILMEHNVLWGTGSIRYTNELLRKYNEERVSHNLYIYILSVSGLIGISLFLFFIWGMLEKCLIQLKRNIFPFCLLIFMLLIAYKTGGVLTYLLMWFVFATVITLTLSNQNSKDNE